MKYLLFLVFIVVLGSGIYGFYLKNSHNSEADKFIGIAVLGLFLVWMPLFIYHRYRGKDIKKYLITDDTIKKIKDEADDFLN